jgi:hypothetical protein
MSVMGTCFNSSVHEDHDRRLSCSRRLCVVAHEQRDSPRTESRGTGSIRRVSVRVRQGAAAQRSTRRAHIRQKHGRLVVGKCSEEQPRTRCDEGGGLGLAHHPRVGERPTPSTLAQHSRSAGQHVLYPVRLWPVADEDGVAIMGLEYQKGRSISLTRLPPDVLERPEVRKPRCDSASCRIGDSLVELCDSSRHAHSSEFKCRSKFLADAVPTLSCQRQRTLERSGRRGPLRCPQSDSNRHCADFKKVRAGYRDQRKQVAKWQHTACKTPL